MSRSRRDTDNPLESDSVARTQAQGAGAQPAPACSELWESTGTSVQSSILSVGREPRHRDVLQKTSQPVALATRSWCSRGAEQQRVLFATRGAPGAA